MGLVFFLLTPHNFISYYHLHKDHIFGKNFLCYAVLGRCYLHSSSVSCQTNKEEKTIFFAHIWGKSHCFKRKKYI